MDYTIIPELTPQEFFGPLDRKAHKLRVPVIGSMELTERCNLNCKHCHINLPTNNRTARAAELSTEEVYRIFDDIADAGCLWLLLTGGDPFLRPDFLDIYAYAKKKGFLVTVFTNGTMITPKIADYFAEWVPRRIEITLYGMTETTYEAVTGLPGSYKKCIRGIELLHERGLPLELKGMGLTINKHELRAMRAYAESLGMKGFKVDYEVNPRLNGSKVPCNVRINPKEIVELQKADTKYWEELQIYEEHMEQIYSDPHANSDPPANSDPSANSDPPANLYNCGAGTVTFHIDAYGRLSLCLISRLNSYDLRQGTFAEGWNNYLLGARTKSRPRDFLCDQCEIEHLCDSCPAWSELVHGVLDKPVEFLCEITHRQAEALGIHIENPVLDIRRLDRDQEELNHTFIPLRVVT